MPHKMRFSRKFPVPPVAKLIGFHLVQAANGKAICEMRAEKKHVNTIGTVHGGILCDLADAAMGYAFLSSLDRKRTGVTMEFKINFLRPVFVSDRLLAVARALSTGKNIYYLECEVRNHKKQLVAKAACSCKVTHVNA